MRNKCILFSLYLNAESLICVKDYFYFRLSSSGSFSESMSELPSVNIVIWLSWISRGDHLQIFKKWEVPMPNLASQSEEKLYPTSTRLMRLVVWPCFLSRPLISPHFSDNHLIFASFFFIKILNLIWYFCLIDFEYFYSSQFMLKPILWYFQSVC